MPRPHEQANVLHEAVHGLMRSITHLVDRLRTVVEGHPADLPVEFRAKATGQRGPGKNNAKLRSALKASWARVTPAQRKARIAKMLAGRGLKPKRAKVAAARGRRSSGGKRTAQPTRRGRRGTSAQVDTLVPPTVVI